MDAELLKALNVAQRKAVEHAPNVPLQILAGPGSGKTKVLTSRIAHLILHHHLPPSSICAVTFTNKAANEMKERLTKLIGKEGTNEVKMGTFHALCALFLRRYAAVVGLEGNFTVCDADESKKIVAKLLKPYKEFLTARNMILKEGTVLSLISKAKAKGHTPDDLLSQDTSSQSRKRIPAGPGAAAAPLDDIGKTVAEIYKDYERALRESNSLDFDDLLVYGVKLFAQHRKAVRWCRHIFVDEFQDTNIMQYDLMRHIAAASQCVTVVGDPDQSIYGWRSAEIANLSKMRRDFPGTEQILLEENYRSTGSILAASLSIVTQDKSRIQKTLHTSHPTGPLPVLRSFPSEHEEAIFIAIEIKRVVASMGGMLGWGDFVVLLRFNALSRAIESALQKESIPSRVLGGHKFFERLEIKDLLAYLQLVDNPNFTPAFSRAVNVPGRGIGEKTLAEILSRAEKAKLSPLAVVEKIHDAKVPDIKPPVKRKLVPFVKTIRILRDLANKGSSPPDLIRRLLKLTEYEDHLRRTQPDWESRWENVQELINFASEVECGMVIGNTTKGLHQEITGLETTSKGTPLRLFLQASMLSSEGDNQDGNSKEKVTIATCHSAKGLEWPVVIVPATEKGIFPFYRSDDLEEERRLLYVACTRAQGLLYLSHATKRKAAGESQTKELSDFISVVVKGKQKLLSSQLPDLHSGHRMTIAKVLNRPVPAESEVQRRVTEFNRTVRYQAHTSESVTETPHDLSRPSLDIPPTDYVPSFQSSSSYLASTTLPRILTSPAKGSSIAKPLSPTSNIVNSAIRQPRGSNIVQSKQISKHSTTNAIAIPSTTHQIISAQLAPRRDVSAAPSHPQLSSITEVPRPPAAGVTSGAGMSNPVAVGVKRRLGMGRAVVGYPSKKFKPPT